MTIERVCLYFSLSQFLARLRFSCFFVSCSPNPRDVRRAKIGGLKMREFKIFDKNK